MSREIATGDVQGEIRGAGMYATTLRFTGSGRLFSNGTPENPSYKAKTFADMTIKNDNPNPNSVGLEFYFGNDGTVNVATCITIQNMVIQGFGTNKITNAPRGVHVENVVVFAGSPYVNNAPVDLAGFSIAAKPDYPWGCFSYRFRNVLVANYRWGWDFQVQSPLEGISFTECAAYNGFGLLNVNCSGTNGYKSILWSINDCDWEGYGHAVLMQNCRNVSVRGGFWIYSDYSGQQLPFFDNTLLPQGWSRRMFWFASCDDVKTDHCEFAAGDMTGAALVNVDGNCRNVVIRDSIVRTYSPAANSFILDGARPRTTREIDTYYLDWGGGNKTWLVSDQVSQPAN